MASVLDSPGVEGAPQGNLSFETSHKTEDEPEDWGRPGVVSLLLHEKYDLGPGLSSVFQVLAMEPPR